MVFREDAPAGSVLTEGAPIRLLHAQRLPAARIHLQSLDGLPEARFRLLENGSLQLMERVDLEAMDDASKGIIELEVSACRNFKF